MPTKPRKPTVKAATARGPRMDTKVDPSSLAPELREFIYRRKEIARERAIEALLSAADAYRAELGRKDNLHQARIGQREEGLMRAAEDLLATKLPFTNLTHWEVELYRRSMEDEAGHETQSSAPNRPAS